MNKIIPILPCKDLKEQIKFYEDLGFTNKSESNTYGVLIYNVLEIHFWIFKKLIPEENASMCFIQVDDVDTMYEKIIVHYTKNNKKIPRNGIPRISKPRDLATDRRFTITDISGNTLFIGTPNKHLKSKANFFRTIDTKKYAKNFAILYDLVYSKEDQEVANNMLVKFFPEDLDTLEINAIDLAKILLTVLEIKLKRNEDIEDVCLKIENLYASHKEITDWDKIIQKYNEMFIE